MAANPGIWVGSMEILLGTARHTNIAIIPGSTGPTVYELQGPFRSATNLMHKAPYPAYSGWTNYVWVKVSGMEDAENVRIAGDDAILEYSGDMYFVSSNRFVSSVMRRASIELTSAHKAVIGWAPGLCWCANCAD
ncbi:MAG TPA: hypothetical protein VFN22_07240 [Gemmatimonadales bacterium]|nr:hypothetical protein [Gemmatimonadales bacterium]